MVYGSEEEMAAVLGPAEENSFIRQVRRETEEFERTVASVRARL